MKYPREASTLLIAIQLPANLKKKKKSLSEDYHLFTHANDLIPCWQKRDS